MIYSIPHWKGNLSINCSVVKFAWAKFIHHPVHPSSISSLAAATFSLTLFSQLERSFPHWFLQFQFQFNFFISTYSCTFFSFTRLHYNVYSFIFFNSFLSFSLPWSSWPSLSSLSGGAIYSPTWMLNMLMKWTWHLSDTKANPCFSSLSVKDKVSTKTSFS